MIAAEIAAHFPRRAERLVLLAPFGLWNDAYPVADIFAMPYTQIDDILWHDHGDARRLRQAGRHRRRRQGRRRADGQAGAQPHRGDQVRLADPRPRPAPPAAAHRLPDAGAVRRRRPGGVAALCRRLQGGPSRRDRRRWWRAPATCCPTSSRSRSSTGSSDFLRRRRWLSSWPSPANARSISSSPPSATW